MKPEDLKTVLSEAGLCRRDSVILHSSFRSLAPFEGTPADVVRVFLEIIGPRGNLVFPSFNYSSPLPEPYYDADITRARTGAIVESGRRISGAVRSLHPTHSVVAIGPDAEMLTRDHLSFRTFGVGSPIDRLAQMGGKIVLLGVAQTSNSTLHIAEEHAKIPKAPRQTPLPCAKIRMPDGKIVEHRLDSSASCSAAFEAASLPLRNAELIRDARCGGCLIQVMNGLELLKCITALLLETPGALLCSSPSCTTCAATRRNIASQKNASQRV